MFRDGCSKHKWQNKEERTYHKYISIVNYTLAKQAWLMMCHDNCCLKHGHKRLKTEETKRYIRILNQLNPRESSTMQKALSTQSQTLRHITQSRGDQIRPFLQLSRQKITHRKNNTFRTTKIVARDWDDGGKRKEDEQSALHDVSGSFWRSFNSFGIVLEAIWKQ
jgi:hypothetical protein